jgi:adenosylcobinamide-phosphate synthase
MIIYEYLIGALALGFIIDFVLGDPANKYHPVRWLGGFIDFCIPKLKVKTKNISNNNNGFDGHTAKEKINGIIFGLSLLVVFGFTMQLIVSVSIHMLGPIIVVVIYGILLKITIAIKGMEEHTIRIIKSLERKDLKNAQSTLSMIVKRNTENLDEQHILSGTIESISESIVDGIVSPLFFYSLFGPTGACLFRIINTLDSMIGYRNIYYENIGWMAAKLDTIVNYIPARISGILIIISAMLVSEDWKNSFKIMKRDHNKTLSLNAGYPMSSMAGSLCIKLEKIGYYSLGDDNETISIKKCESAITIMKLAALLSCFVLSLPFILILYLIGWWNLLFGF